MTPSLRVLACLFLIAVGGVRLHATGAAVAAEPTPGAMQGSQPPMGGAGSTSGTTATVAGNKVMPGMSPNFDASTLPATVKQMIDQFMTLRNKLTTDRQALILKLKGASETQRKQLVAAFIASEKSVLDQQKTVAKQIREEIRALRRNGTGAPVGGSR